MCNRTMVPVILLLSLPFWTVAGPLWKQQNPTNPQWVESSKPQNARARSDQTDFLNNFLGNVPSEDIVPDEESILPDPVSIDGNNVQSGGGDKIEESYSTADYFSHASIKCRKETSKKGCEYMDQCYWYDPKYKKTKKQYGYGSEYDSGPLCIHNSERFYNVLSRLLSKRGKKDFAIKIKYSSAAAQGELPFGPYGPAIIDDGYAQHFFGPNGYTYGGFVPHGFGGYGTPGYGGYEPYGYGGYEPYGYGGHQTYGNDGYEPYGSGGYEPYGYGGYEPYGNGGYESYGNNGGYEPYGNNGGYESYGNNGGYEPYGNNGGYEPGYGGYEPYGYGSNGYGADGSYGQLGSIGYGGNGYDRGYGSYGGASYQ